MGIEDVHVRPPEIPTDEELHVRELGIKNNLKQAEVKTLIDYYKRKDPDNQGLLPEQFKQAAGEFIAAGLTIDPNVVFKIFDSSEAIGRVTMREFILGYAILCRGTTENRLHYLFSVYGGPDPINFLTRDQLISSLKLAQRIVSEVSEVSDLPDDTNAQENDTHIADVADNLIAESSNPQSNTISYDDFIEKVKESDVMSWLEKLSTIAGEHFKYIEQLELEVVNLNMEREGILSSGTPPNRVTMQQSVDWTDAAPQPSSQNESLALRSLPNDKKRKIPMPRKQKLVRRDLRAHRSASEADFNRVAAAYADDMDDDEINAAKPFLINYDQIQFGNILGRGACATVYQGTWMHIPVAVKVFNDGHGNAAGTERLSATDEEVRKSVVGDYVEEFWLLLQIRHPNCLLYMGICFEPVVCIVTELFTGGSVANFLHGPNAQKFTPTTSLEMISGVARGMYYLHASSPPILHRDLKASNILINRLVSHCVICDFGLSAQFVSEASGLNVTGSRKDEVGVVGIGTPYTMAPEVMQRMPHTPAADVYSFGIVMYEMYTGRRPFPKLKPVQVMFHVSEGHRPTFFDTDKVPTTLRKLMEDCWVHDPKLRLSFEDILKVLTSQKLAEEVEAAQLAMVDANQADGKKEPEKSIQELSKQLMDDAYIGNSENLLRLINRGAKVDYCDYDKRTPLHVAAAEGHLECMRVLIRAGARLFLDRWNNSPIADAVNYDNRSGDSEPVRLLRAIESRQVVGTTSSISVVKPDAKDQEALQCYMAMVSAAKGDVSSLRKILDEGLDANSCDYDRRTPLMVAASEGRLDVAELLLQHGANIRNRDRWGSTAYDEAERGGYHDIMLLIRQSEQKVENESFYTGMYD